MRRHLVVQDQMWRCIDLRRREEGAAGITLRDDALIPLGAEGLLKFLVRVVLIPVGLIQHHVDPRDVRFELVGHHAGLRKLRECGLIREEIDHPLL